MGFGRWMISWKDTMWRPVRCTDFRCPSLKPKATAAAPLKSSSDSSERGDESSAFVWILRNSGETGQGMF